MPSPAALVTLLLSAALPAQLAQPKVFHNDGRADRVERDTAGVDRIYGVADPRFHAGYGQALGFRIALQDEDAATSEQVRVGWVRLDAKNPDLPDVTTAGTIAEVGFSVFGTGKGRSAVLWTLTLGSATTLPATHGTTAQLPAAKLDSRGVPIDGLFVFNQGPGSLKLPPGATPKHWMYVLVQGQAQAWDAVPGGTWYWGTYYEEPVAQVVCVSQAYGKSGERLAGPESLFPWSTRGDLVGLDLESRALIVTGSRKPGVAVAMFTANPWPNGPLQTPFGDLFVDPAVLLTVVAPLDAQGRGAVPGLPIPGAGLRFRCQAVFVDPNATGNAALRLSDAQDVTTH
ncbi:MAG: hypothetical protein R3F30_06935 [Planctomycetota bacterium]